MPTPPTAIDGPSRTLTSSARIIRCFVAREAPAGRSSSTRRCTRRRSPTCGTRCLRPKRRPRGTRRCRRDDATVARRRPRRAIPGGRATLGTARDDRRFAWDNERPAHQVRSGVQHRRPQRDERASSWRSSTPAATAIPAGGATEDWAGCQSDAVTHPHSGTTATDDGTGAAMFERVPLPASVAGVCDLGGGERLRALARPAPADRSGVPSRGLRDARSGARAAVPLGRRTPASCRQATSISRAGIRSRRRAPEGASAFGVHDLVGNGWEWTSRCSARSRASPPWRRIRNTPPTSSTMSTS